MNAAQQALSDAREYDEENHRLIATNREMTPRGVEYGASAIVASNVEPSWGRHFVQLEAQLSAAIIP